MDDLDAWWDKVAGLKATRGDKWQRDDALVEFCWLLEEYRVSLFAQPVGTRVPVSNKRLQKAWQGFLA